MIIIEIEDAREKRDDKKIKKKNSEIRNFGREFERSMKPESELKIKNVTENSGLRHPRTHYIVNEKVF